jgi:mannose/fructose/N-acetylgalactosamine-specific phosphotransferase system component IIB
VSPGAFLLVRVDDRLLHGQVAVGWAASLKPARIYVVDDEAAASPWEVTLYKGSAPATADVQVLPLAAFASVWDEGRVDAPRSFVLLRSPEAALALLDAGVPFASLNVGGMRHRDGAREVLPYVWLRPEDEQALRELAARGVALVARDLPMNAGHDLSDLLAG